MPTNTQEMVTIIFKPSPPPDLWSLTFGAFTKGAMVPGVKQQQTQVSYTCCLGRVPPGGAAIAQRAPSCIIQANLSEFSGN